MTKEEYLEKLIEFEFDTRDYQEGDDLELSSKLWTLGQALKRVREALAKDG